MFLSRIKADASGDRSPWGSFWFEPVGMMSSTGMRVTGGSAMRLSAVYSCVRVLAETFASLPFRLYKIEKNGDRTEVVDHWLYRLFSKAPNAWQTPFEWREMMMGHLCLRGNAFNQIVNDGRGGIDQLVPIHPDRITLQRLDNGNFNYRVKQLDGSFATLGRADVWHLRGLSGDGYVGLNPIEVASEVFGLGLAAQTYGSRFFANNAKPGGWLEMSGKFADDDAKKAFKAEWQASQGGANNGKTAILPTGMKYHELTLNNSDAQFLESRKFSRSEIASLFRVPPHKIGDLDKATFSNIEQQSLDFVNDTMTPWAERWESSIEYFLMLDSDKLEVEFDFANLLRGDSAARAVFYKAGINDGWMTRNEVRRTEGLKRIEGLDKPLRPLNMVENDAAPAVPAGQVIKPAPVDDAPDDSAGARTFALARAAAERVARRELQVVKAVAFDDNWPQAVAAVYQAHAPFVAACLSVDIEAARAYCESRGADPMFKRTTESDFLAIAASKLEKLALKGTL